MRDTDTTVDGSEASLIEGLRRNDPASCELFVRQNLPAMLAVARRLLGDAGAAEDCVQEAFVKAFQAIDTFEQRSRLATWLHRITVNQALTRLRQRRNEEPPLADHLLPDFDRLGFRIEPRWDSVPADELLDRQKIQEHVRAKISELPESYRSVLVLRDLEELSTAEVARMLDTSEGNVKVRLHRARSALKVLLEPILRGDPS